MFAALRKAEYDSGLRRAVLIEPSLQYGSPENGNISACGRRLSVFSPLNLPNPDHRDRLLNRESPPLAGISEVTQGQVSRRRTGWLTWEDSNLHIPD